MSSGLEIDGGLFASVLLDLVGDFLPFMETVEPGTLNRADMDEYGCKGLRGSGGIGPVLPAASHSAFRV
jgi:hypothetical protein